MIASSTKTFRRSLIRASRSCAQRVVVVHAIFVTGVSVLLVSTVSALPATQMTITQDPAGHVHVQLSGYAPHCITIDPSVFVVPQSSTFIDIQQSETNTTGEACSGATAESYNAEYANLRPYVSTADLGILGDGDYRVRWGFVNCCWYIDAQASEWLSIRAGQVIVASAIGTFLAPPVVTPSTPYNVHVSGISDEGPITVTQAGAGLASRHLDFLAFYNVDLLLNHGLDDVSALYQTVFSGPPITPGQYSIYYTLNHTYPGSPEIFENDGPGYTSDFAIVLPDGARAAAIEYYNPQRDHYFMTVDAAEIAALDAGIIQGWIRTRAEFPVLVAEPDAYAAQAGLSPVCRYYGRPEFGLDTHFFSVFSDECAAVIANWPDQWIRETSNAFQVIRPYISDGACPPGTSPVYRVYNNRYDVNHRYTTSLGVRQQMIDKGWVPEGYGPVGVAMCTVSAVTTG